MNGPGVIPKLTVSLKIESFLNLANRGEVFDTFYLNAPGVILKLTSPIRDVKFFEIGQRGVFGDKFLHVKNGKHGVCLIPFILALLELFQN